MSTRTLCFATAVLVATATATMGCKKPPKPPHAEPATSSAVDEATADALLDRLGTLDTPPPALSDRLEPIGDDLWEHLVLTRTLLAHEHDTSFSSDDRRLLTRELGFVSAQLAAPMERDPDDVAAEIRFLVGQAQ